MRKIVVGIIFATILYAHTSFCMKQNDSFCSLITFNVNERDQDGDAPLHKALKHNAVAEVHRLLTQYPVDIAARNSQGQSYLDIAIRSGNKENEQIIREVLRNELFTNFFYKKCFGEPLATVYRWQIIDNLLSSGAYVDARNNAGETLLHCPDVTEKMIEILFKHGSNPNIQDKYGYTPLHTHIFMQNKKVIQRLLKHEHIDLMLCDGQGYTPLVVAKELDYCEGVQLVSTALDEQLLAALRWHSLEDYCETVEVLLAGGANVDVYEEDGGGYSALDYAIISGCRKCIQLLIENKVNPNICNRYGQTPLYFAVKKGLVDVVALLFTCGVRVHMNGSSDKELLECAVSKSYPSIVNMLFDNGALVSHRLCRKVCNTLFSDFSEDMQPIVSLLKSRYKEQHCCICFETQKTLEQLRYSLGYIPCKKNHQRNFICSVCYQYLPSVDGKKQCVFGCPEGVKKYESYES